jgi:glutathione synthase/RimK-type ligase-like ATP-grasp enzyme
VPSHLILVENPKDWAAEFPDVELITARDYLMQPEQYKTKGLHIVNLCRSYRYCSTGYYCSLLAEARRHKIVPSVRTITDLASKAIYSLNVEDLDDLIQRVLRKRARDTQEIAFEANIFFGQSEDRELQELARQIFDLFQAPLLRVEFRRQQRWEIASLRPVPLRGLTPEQGSFFSDSLNTYLSSRWRTRRARPQPYYDFAILYNPDEQLPPSNMGALRRFIEAGKKVDADVELITRKDYNRLAEYDALLIRETTAINHHTYRFAKKAEAEGIVVIDDPDSIVKCTNKVYLAELLAFNRVATPRTLVLRKGEAADLEAAVGYPAVLKIPDGSFSRGVHKASSPAEAAEITTRLFRDSDLILAQEYLYTEYDWRIGILNNEVLFACRYFMSPKHWQIVRHDARGRATEGGYASFALEDVPPQVIKVALAAARLIGNGLYGVDVKERDGQVYVIEVNDNPNLESGVEDGILGAELYRRILAELVRRIELRRAN